MESQDSRPRCGDDFSQLGVTVHPHASPDVYPDKDGCVEPGTGGMSVFTEIKRLPGRLIPMRLRELYPEDLQKASGDDSLIIWCIDTDKFQDDPSTSELVFTLGQPAKRGHGTIEPRTRMQVAKLLLHLCATKDQWQVCETL